MIYQQHIFQAQKCPVRIRIRPDLQLIGLLNLDPWIQIHKKRIHNTGCNFPQCFSAFLLSLYHTLRRTIWYRTRRKHYRITHFGSWRLVKFKYHTDLAIEKCTLWGVILRQYFCVIFDKPQNLPQNIPVHFNEFYQFALQSMLGFC